MSVGPGHVGRSSGAGYARTGLLLGATAIFALEGVAGLGDIAAWGSLTALLAVLAAIDRMILHRGLGRERGSPARVAVIGGVAVAERLRADLDCAARRFVLAGRLAVTEDAGGSVRVLGHVDGLREALVAHHIQLLILSPYAPRESVFEQIVSRCMDLPVQLVELAAFYEAEFGYVPISETNAVWFQYLIDPSARHPNPLGKRMIDLLGVALLAVPALALCGVLVLLIRRDGSPAIFRQVRIGECGRPFTLYKLRTMHPRESGAARWAAVNDDRVTWVGRILRYTHLDELPQLFNVLRGEMSLVGPRPEQAAIVEHLERAVPFYQRRHQIRPGITGWAQIRCGYGRSDAGSLWKHCHDLYYLKHRSIRLDLWILAVTARTIVVCAIRGTEATAQGGTPVEEMAASIETVPAPEQIETAGAPSPASQDATDIIAGSTDPAVCA